MRKLNIIELFAGSQSFAKAARKLGHNTFTSDIKNMKGIDYVCDILNFEIKNVPFVPDIAWCSPDCSTWSKAAGKTHFNSKSLEPKTDKAKTAFYIIDYTLNLMYQFLDLNPSFKFYIENPEGKMQKYLQASTLFGNGLRLVIIDQCQYGREFQKTTHIFTNDYDWNPRQRCRGRPICNHKPNIKQSNFSSLGTLDRQSYYKRAMIPEDLCLEILELNANCV